MGGCVIGRLSLTVGMFVFQGINGKIADGCESE